jgi:hypothetical protein
MNFIKSNLKYIVPIAVFALLTMLFMAPAFNGKVVRQGDIEQYSGASKEILDYKAKEGHGPLWTNSMFGGMPSYQISYEPPNNFAKYLRDISIFRHPVNMLFIGMLFAFILLLTFGVNPWIAAIGGVAYAFSSYNIILIEAGHNTKLYAIGYAPLLLAGLNLLLSKKYLIGAGVTAAAMALQLQANHFQITYYLGLIIAFWLIAEFIVAIKNKTLKPLIIASSIFGVASLIGMGTNSVSLLLTEEYSKETIRGKSELTYTSKRENNRDTLIKKPASNGLDIDYAFDWSQGWEELPTIIIPNFVGGGSGTELGKNDATRKVLKEISQSQDPQQSQQARQLLAQNINPWAYWGPLTFTSGPVYFGALVLFLFVAGLFYSKNSTKWWWLAALVFSLFLSLGENFMSFNGFIFHYLPFYNKFRSVNMSLVIGQIAVAIFAIISLNDLLKEKADKAAVKKALLRALYVTAGFCFLMLLYSGGADFVSSNPNHAAPFDAVIEDRASYLRMDAMRSIFFIAAGFAAFWYFLKGKLKVEYTMAIVGLLILVDLWSVDRRYINDKSWEKEKTYKADNAAPSEADLQILKDKSYYRVYDASQNPFTSAKASYFHHSVGGYHAAKLRRYQEVIEWHIVKGDQDIMNMLNTKYYIQQDEQTNALVAAQNPDACGNVWFAKELKIMDDANQEIMELGKINPKNTVLVDKRFGKQLEGFNINFDSSAAIQLDSYHPDKLTYNSNSKTPQLAVFSEIYYNEKKGWNAYLDGKKVPHFRCNYILRGMVIPAGSHKIEFKFEPSVLKTASTVSLVSNVGMYLLLLAGIGSLFMKPKKQEAA